MPHGQPVNRELRRRLPHGQPARKRPADNASKAPPGEVSNAALEMAIAGTSANSNAVSPLALMVSDPPTQAEVQAVISKLNELISALRR